MYSRPASSVMKMPCASTANTADSLSSSPPYRWPSFSRSAALATGLGAVTGALAAGPTWVTASQASAMAASAGQGVVASARGLAVLATCSVTGACPASDAIYPVGSALKARTIVFPHSVEIDCVVGDGSLGRRDYF